MTGLFIINPQAIAAIIFYDEATFDPSSIDSKQAETIMQHWKPDRMKANDGFDTPIMMITMLSGEAYLIAATDAGMDHALNISSQIFNGTYEHERKSVASPQKRHTLNRRGRIDDESKRGGPQLP